MLQRIAFIISVIFITSLASAGQSFDTTYSHTEGSNDYKSNAIACETTFNNAKMDRSLTGTLNLLSDSDYSLIGTLTMKPKIKIGNGMNTGLILGLSEGSQKNSSTVSAFSFGILIDKNIKDVTTATLEYVHTYGNIYTEIYRNVLEQTVRVNGNGKAFGKKNRISTTSTTTVQTSEINASEYSSDTIAAIFDTDMSFIIENLSSYAQLSFSQSSEDIKIASVGLSLIYHINTKTSFYCNFTTTNNNLDQSDNYYGLGLTRSF
jgi:hypothetical protein